MNKLKILIVSLSLIFINGCEKLSQIEKVYTTSVTIYLINETNVIVKSDDKLRYTIKPGETLIHKEITRRDGDRPKVNEYFLSFLENNNSFEYQDNKGNCEQKIRNIDFYENKKELTGKNNTIFFELTFKFTEEKKQTTTPCK